MMSDITDLIRADHDWFREQFARLEELQSQVSSDSRSLQQVWCPLADKLDVHAYIEEKIFYPRLLERGADDPEDETLDAIGDHNDIRDGVRDAHAASVGSDSWWAAVGRTRAANDDHMSEEERDGLTDFRANAPADLRNELGREYRKFMALHPTPRGLLIVDRDPQTYIDDVGATAHQRPKDGSLGIGSLKGQP
jgi:Hemerythrin HHE cation binding domain